MSFVWDGCDLCCTLDGKHSFPCYCRCHHANEATVSARGLNLAAALMALILLGGVVWMVLWRVL